MVEGCDTFFKFLLKMACAFTCVETLEHSELLRFYRLEFNVRWW